LNLNKKTLKRFDFILIIDVIILSVYGLIMIGSATSGGNFLSNPYVKTQLIAFILGLIAVVILLFIDYEIYGNLYLFIYGISNILLLAVLFFGFGEDQWGARSWLSIGPITFQPSEVAKIGIIISLSKFIEKNEDNLNNPLTLLKVIGFAAVPIVLILLQPDFGTAMVMLFFIAIMFFISGIDYKYILSAVVVGLISLPIVYMNLEEFQLNRIKVFFNPELDPQGAGYQVLQSKIAIGSGKLFGRGLYQGVQNQYGFLPAKETDFIFAVIGEELGLIGGGILIFLYIVLMYRLIKISKNALDTFGSLMVIGFTGMMLFHIFENIGMTIGLTPVTGIPLPFISYGGTFMLVNMICIGLSLNVALKREGLEF
jgi:rod shape determining protein RodA